MKTFQIIQRTTSSGQIVAIPTALIPGTNPGPTLAIVAAVHGCEYCGVEATVRLYQDLNPEEMSGTLRMAMVANMPAFQARTMYKCPIDGGNAGRAFPGTPSGTYTQLIGYTVWNEIVGDAEYVLDLHGGDLIEILTHYVGYHTTGDERLDRKSEAFACAFGAKNIEVRPLSDQTADLSISQAAVREGKVGLLVEAGSQGRRDEEDVHFHYQGIINVMRHIGILPGTPEAHEGEVCWLDEFIGVKAGVEGLFYPAVEADEIVEFGQVLGYIRSFTGELLDEIKSPAKAVVLGVITPAGTYEDATLFGLGRLKA